MFSSALLKTRRLVLRDARREDLVGLRDLIAAAPASMGPPGLAGEVAPAAIEQLLIASGLDERRRLLIIVKKGGGPPVGLLLAQVDRPFPRAAFIELLLLAPQSRGSGFGREACQGWQDWARRKHKVLEIQAAVHADSHAAHAFWAALGYRDTGEVRPDDGGRVFRILAFRP